MSDVFVYPREFERCVSLLTHKVEQIAIKFGACDDDCADLESALKALSPLGRARVEAMLNGVQLHAADDHPTMAFAARYVINLAREIWEESPLSMAVMAGAMNEGSGAVE